MDGFRYQQLDLRSSAFRLIRLLKAPPYASIECELIYVKLDENVIPYEAVSYTWGTSVRPLSIKLDGKRFMVTLNLWHLLDNVRKPEEDRYLWVDAIAINQDDDLERGHQVRRMKAIYSGAERVLFYLGEESATTSILMESLFMLQRDISGGRWAPGDERWKTAWENVQRKLELTYGTTSKDVQLRGLEELLKRPWFRRVWILQEVANARRALVCCGAISVRAQVFAMAPILLRVDLDYHVESVFQLMPTFSGKNLQETRSRNLCSALLGFRGSESSDPRDKIFALLGLCGGQYPDPNSWIVPDYTQTESEVIHITASYIMGESDKQYLLEIDELQRETSHLKSEMDLQSAPDLLPSNIDQFLWDLAHSSDRYMEILLAKILSKMNIEVLRSFLGRRENKIPINPRMLEAVELGKSNKLERVSLLFQHGRFSEPFPFASVPDASVKHKTNWCHTCISFVEKFETMMEIYGWSHGDVAVWIQQEHLYPFLFFASKPFLGRLLLHLLKVKDIKTSQLLHKAQQIVDWEKGFQEVDIEDDPREYVNYSAPTIGRGEILRVLVEHHFNPILGIEVWTQLFLAILTRETEMVELVLGMSLELYHTPCESANFAFHLAIGYHHELITQCLLEGGVKIQLGYRVDRLNRHCDPFSLALHNEDYDIVDLFRPYPMAIVAPNGISPLHFAVESSNELLVQFLLTQNA
ncbi:heterokaryon incompatibility protein-domain-containing protein [Xylaria sp. FL1042]|nr:heterokaryon incompatibility protein-domain-containing protein [Xylaria sp. FL1042]